MKKSLIAFAVLGAFASAASAQSSVVLYGVVDANVSSQTNQSTTGGKKNALESSGLSSGRRGFKGSEDLGSGLKANFNLESSLAVDTGVAGSLFDRRATVGLSGSFGAFDAGRQTNLAYDTLSQIDPTSFAHPGTNPNVNLGSLNNATLYNTHGSSNGVSSAARENNSIKYSAPAMFGSVVFTGMYGFGEKTGDTVAGSYMGTSATYSKDGVVAVLSYSQLRDAANNSTLRAYTGGAKFPVTSDVTVKVSYAENQVNTSRRDISVTGAGLDYAATPMWTLTGAYYYTHRAGDMKATAKTWVGLAKYAFSKRTTAYASFSYAKAATVQAKDTDLGLIIGANNRSATRTVVGVNHAF